MRLLEDELGGLTIEEEQQNVEFVAKIVQK